MIDDKKLNLSREAVLLLLAKAETIVAKAAPLRVPPPTVESPEMIKQVLRQNEELLKTLKVREMKKKKLHDLNEAIDDAEASILDCRHRLGERRVQINQIRELWAELATRLEIACDEIDQIREQIPVVSTQESEMAGFIADLDKEMEEAQQALKVATERAELEQEDQLLNGDIQRRLPPRQSKLTAGAATDLTQNKAASKWARQGAIESDGGSSGAADAKPAALSTDAAILASAVESEYNIKDRVKRLWDVAYFAVRLKMLDKPPGFLTSPEVSSPSQLCSVTSNIAADAGSSDKPGLRRFSKVMNLSNALSQISDLMFQNRKMSDELHMRRRNHREAELKLAALTDRYEKLRVEVAATRRVNASFDGKTFEDLRAEIRFYQRERTTLYSKLYRNKQFEIPAVKPIYLSESALLEAGVMEGAVASPAGLSVRALSPTSPQQMPGSPSIARSASMSPQHPSSQRRGIITSRGGGGMADAIDAATKEVEDRITEHNKPPHGAGYLQRVIGTLQNEKVKLQFRHEQDITRRLRLQNTLQVTENIAMFNFDSYLKGRQTVEEEMERLMVEHQRTQVKLINRNIRDREEAEAAQRELTARNDSLMRENASLAYNVKSLEDQVGSLQAKCNQLQDQHDNVATRLAAAEIKVPPEELQKIDDYLQQMRNFSSSSAVGSDPHLMRILPMASQRMVSGHATKVLDQLAEGVAAITSLLRVLFKDSVRQSPVSSQILQNLVSRLGVLFESVTQGVVGTGKTSYDLLDAWFMQYKSCLVSTSTDMLDLFVVPSELLTSSTSMSVVNQTPPAPPPPPQTDDEVQAGRSYINFQTSAASAQTATIQVRSVIVGTEMVLGTGAPPESSGFVSKERVEKLEAHYKSVVSKVADALKQAEKAAVHFARKLRGGEEMLMAAEDQLSWTRTRLVQLSQEIQQLKQRPSTSVCSTQTDVTPVHGFSSQVFFPESDLSLERLQPFAVPIHSSDSECTTTFEVSLPQKIEHANILVQATVTVVSTGADAPLVSLRHSSSITDLDMKDIAELQKGAASQAQQSRVPLPIIPLKHSEVQTEHVYVYLQDMDAVAESLKNSVSERVAAEREKLDQAMSSRLDAVASKEAAASLLSLQLEEAQQHIRREVTRAEKEMLDAQRLRQSLEGELSSHRENMEIEAKALMEKSHRLQTMDEERQRHNIKLHARVSDMQTDFEAFDASVARYKNLDAENAALRKELETLREVVQKEGGRRGSRMGSSSLSTRARESIQLDRIISVMTKNSAKEDTLTDSLTETQARLKQMTRERDDLKLKNEAERIRATELEKQLQLFSANPLSSMAISVKKSGKEEDDRRDELQRFVRQVSCLKSEVLQLNITLKSAERSSEELRLSLESQIRDLAVALDKATSEKRNLKKDLDTVKTERETMAVELQNRLAEHERTFQDELEGRKLDTAKLKSNLSELLASNVHLQKEVKRLKGELEPLEAFRSSSHIVAVVTKRIETAYKSHLASHWKVSEICTNIRRYLGLSSGVAQNSNGSPNHHAARTATPSSATSGRYHQHADLGALVAKCLSGASSHTDEDLDDAVRKMVLEDLDQLMALSTAVRVFAERHGPSVGGGGGLPEGGGGASISPRALLEPWSTSVSRSGSPPRVPEKLIQVLASIPDQPAVTIPSARHVLTPVGMTVQPVRPRPSPTSPPSTPPLNVHVINDGLPKRVGSSHQALSGKHRQIIQARNDH